MHALIFNVSCLLKRVPVNHTVGDNHVSLYCFNFRYHVEAYKIMRRIRTSSSSKNVMPASVPMVAFLYHRYAANRCRNAHIIKNLTYNLCVRDEYIYIYRTHLYLWEKQQFYGGGEACSVILLFEISRYDIHKVCSEFFYSSM